MHNKLTKEDFINLSLHDQSIEQIEIDFTLNSLRFSVGIFNDDKNNYDYLQLVFLNVVDMNISRTAIGNLESLEISSYNISEKDNNWDVNFRFLSESNEPEWIISFLCKEILQKEHNELE